MSMNSQNSTTDLDLSIIIVNYNGEHYISDCLDSVFESPLSYSYEVIVVDNASQDDSLKILDSYKNRVQLIVNESNVGFAKANNQCLPLCKGRYVLLLNNDTVIRGSALQHLLDFYEAHPEAAALSPKLLNADGSVQVQGSFLGSWRFYSKQVKKVPFICGAAMLTTRAFLQSIGGLDAELFFYNDDIDFCKQAAKAGKPIYYLPDAKVTHFGGLSTKTRKAESMMAGYFGSLYLSKKLYPLPIHYLYRAVLWLDLLPRLLVSLVLSTVLKKRRVFLKLYWKVIVSTVTGKFHE